MTERSSPRRRSPLDQPEQHQENGNNNMNHHDTDPDDEASSPNPEQRQRTYTTATPNGSRKSQARSASSLQNHQHHSNRSVTSSRLGLNDSYIPSQPQQPQSQPQQSLSDQVVSSAVAGTVELLKLAGGWTLSATGKVVAPPLQVTQRVLLPHLWAATVDVLATSTPPRLQDWFRIVQSAVVQFVSVLTRTERGQAFAQRLVVVIGDVIDCLSSTATRQVLVDMTATSVKLGEALYTPECQRFLEQVTILTCRILQAVSSGRTQQFVHDLQQVSWAACAVWADPQTITALAEVTAYLCYALEMEDAILDGGYANSQDHPKAHKQARRHERDVYQTRTYMDRTLLRNPNATVEEAILSSLGKGPQSTSTATTSPTTTTHDQAKQHHPVNMSACSSVSSMFGTDDPRHHKQSHNNSPSHSVLESETRSIRAQVEDARVASSSWEERARRDVNVEYLKQQIGKRVPPRGDRTDKEDDVENIPRALEIESPSNNNRDKKVTTPTMKPRRQRTAIHVETVDSDDDDDEEDFFEASQADPDDLHPSTRQIPPKLATESSTHYFYRVLDDILSEKRADGVDRIVKKAGDDTFLAPGHVHRNGTEPKDSIRQRIATLRAELTQNGQKDSWNRHTPSTNRDQSSWFSGTKQKYLVLSVIVVSLLLGGTWFGLGCYGLWIMIYGSTSHDPRILVPLEEGPNYPPRPSGSASSDNEIVIRVVREVVHVNRDGVVLGKSPEQLHLSQDRIDSISECVAQAV